MITIQQAQSSKQSQSKSDFSETYRHRFLQRRHSEIRIEQCVHQQRHPSFRRVAKFAVRKPARVIVRLRECVVYGRVQNVEKERKKEEGVVCAVRRRLERGIEMQLRQGNNGDEWVVDDGKEKSKTKKAIRNKANSELRELHDTRYLACDALMTRRT